MKTKPAHFTLIRFHHVVTSKCLQHPGNKRKDLRNVQKFKGYSSYGLSVYLWVLFFFLNLIFTALSALKTVLKKSIQPDNKNSQAKCSPAVN